MASRLVGTGMVDEEELLSKEEMNLFAEFLVSGKNDVLIEKVDGHLEVIAPEYFGTLK